ncbi:hypothetical protein SD51_12130 [Alicyclobacillus tengchongensis]|nr:hypothetical protein SD51_12130 [Alicyclobacillus tengchongensis]
MAEKTFPSVLEATKHTHARADQADRYEAIIERLRRRAEDAARRYEMTRNVHAWSSELALAVLEALDDGLSYPNFQVRKFLELEAKRFDRRKESDARN